MKNADYIRSMDDYELAEFLCSLTANDNCYKCRASAYCMHGHNGMIDWLRKEGDHEQG